MNRCAGEQRPGPHFLKELLETDADQTGLELLRRVKMVSNLFDIRENDLLRASGLTGPRLRILIHLLFQGREENSVSSTDLSVCQNVSKNTISSLLRSLEEQGLIVRNQDEEDKRVYHIAITPAGRQLVARVAPGHFAAITSLSAGLSPEEQRSLAFLLEKLRVSITLQGAPRQPEQLSGGD